MVSTVEVITGVRNQATDSKGTVPIEQRDTVRAWQTEWLLGVMRCQRSLRYREVLGRQFVPDGSLTWGSDEVAFKLREGYPGVLEDPPGQNGRLSTAEEEAPGVGNKQLPRARHRGETRSACKA